MTNLLTSLNAFSDRVSGYVSCFVQNNPVASYVLLPIFLSVVAGVIFWFIFSYLPDMKRKNKIRPILFLDIATINMELFFVFDTVMGHQYPAPSFFQRKIKTYTLSYEDILLGLQNKCLNESYLYYKDINQLMIVVGHKLQERFENMTRLINRTFNFSHLLTNEEVLLLSKIRKETEVYDLKFWTKKTAQGSIGGRTIRPVDSSMSFMAKSLTNLYSHYIELDNLVDKNSNDQPRLLNKLFLQNKYNDVVKLSKKIIKKEKSTNTDYTRLYLFESLYYIGCKREAYIELEKYLQATKDIVSARNSVSNKLWDKTIRRLIRKHINKNKIKEFFTVVKEEKNFEVLFNEQQKKIQDYFAEKLADELANPSMLKLKK